MLQGRAVLFQDKEGFGVGVHFVVWVFPEEAAGVELNAREMWAAIVQAEQSPCLEMS